MNSALRSGSVAAPLILLLLTVPVCSTLAQQEDTPVLRSTTRLVQLNAVVLDKGRHPVKDLKQGDFEVFDNGVAQKIVHFASGPEKSAAVQSNTSPLIISNRQAIGDQAPGVTAILVDELILDASGPVPVDLTAPIRSARLSVIRFLATLQPGEPVALYALRREGVVVIHDFTDSPASIIAAARTLGGGGARGKSINLDNLGSQRAHTLNEWPRIAPTVLRQGASPLSEDTNRVMRDYGLQAVVKHLEGVPGRKNLVWISSTFPMAATDFDLGAMLNGRDANIPVQPTADDPTPTPRHPSTGNHFEQLREFARWLSNANVAVYPIDAHGLTTAGSSVGQWSAVDMIARETGGQAVFDSNALDQHLQEIVAEGNTSYQIGYYPGDAAWDGKYHRIEIKLARGSSGFVTRYRKGYYAADETKKQDEDAALWETARSVVEAPAIGVTLSVPSNPLEKGPEQIVLKVDLRDIRFVGAAGRSNAQLDIAFVQFAKDGRVVEGFKDRVAMALPPEVYNEAETDGWYYRKAIWVNGETEKLRVVVRDIASGDAGSVSVPVHAF